MMTRVPSSALNPLSDQVLAPLHDEALRPAAGELPGERQLSQRLCLHHDASHLGGPLLPSGEPVRESSRWGVEPSPVLR